MRSICGLTWVNSSKTPRQHLPRNAGAGILHFDDDLIVFGVGLERDVPACRRVLCRIGQQIDDDLFHARRVDMQGHLSRRHLDVETMLMLVDDRPRGARRSIDQGRGIDVLFLQLDFVARDPRDVEQIVDQT